MAKIDPALQLQPDEVDQLMRTEKYLRIATIGPGSQINLTPMTFGWAHQAVYIFGRGQKVANLRRSGNATVLLDVGLQWRELKGIMMRGQATILESREDEFADLHLAEAQRNLGEKHGLTKDGVPAPYVQTASGNTRRWIVFVPESVTTWDNSKLPR